jgi:CP family cyanate transporter-like MFS transporter
VPLLESTGSWRIGLAGWVIPVVIVALLWVPVCLRAERPARGSRQPAVNIWGDALAWQVSCFMGLQSGLAYCVMGWMAPILRWRGVEGTTAGLYVSLSILVQVAACLFLPPLATRFRSQSVINVTLALVAAGSFLGMLYAPPGWLPVLALTQGLGQGGLFAMAMTVIILRSPDARVAARLSGMSQAVGYVLAAGGPMLVGVIHSVTDGYLATSWLFLGLGAGIIVFGWSAGRPLLVRPRERSAT